MNPHAAFVSDLFLLSRAPLSKQVSDAARERLLDYLGVTLAGARILREKGGRLLELFGAGAGLASLIGFRDRADPHVAALLNGMSAHVAELDDGERRGMVHPGAPVISALFSLAETRGLSVSDLLRGIVVGYEATIGFARAVQPALKDHGYHATGVCGTVGAAMGVSAALGFSESRMRVALSVAMTSAAGTLHVIRGASELKPFNAGRAAQAGCQAALVAEAGFAGPGDALDGGKGFFGGFSESAEATMRRQNDGDPLLIEDIYVKVHSACRHCHAPIEAALELRTTHSIRPEKIEAVRVLTHRWAVHMHDHVEIDGETAAKMSIPFSVAVALTAGRASLHEFMPHWIQDANLQALTRKVVVLEDAEMTALVPAARPALVEVYVEGGAVCRKYIDLPMGEPETRLSSEQLRAKFFSLAEYGGLNRNAAEFIHGVVVGGSTDLSVLFTKRLLSPASV